MTLQSSPPLLSILIPVYNGEKYLRHLLRLFADACAANPDLFRDVEIIVTDNCSTDATKAVADAAIAGLPILHPLTLEPHVPTAEENIFRSFAHCRGVFTWALGVDDIPNFEAFSRVVDELRKQEYDFYLSNFALASADMEVKRSSNFYMTDTPHPVDIVTLTQRFGFWFIIAGISGQIVRTEYVRDYDLQGVIAQSSKIYAHITAYLECFKGHRTVILNETLVFYKLTHADVGHWKRTAEKLGVFDEYFWTLGYILQLEYLERKGIIAHDYLRYMVEMNESHVFRPVFVVADKIASQVRLMERSTDRRNWLTQEQYAHMTGYLARKDPFMREFVWKLDAIFSDVYATRKIADARWKDLEKCLDGYKDDFVLASLLVATHLDYEIYRVGDRYYGVTGLFRDTLTEKLRYLDDWSKTDDIISGDSLSSIREKLKGLRDVRPSKSTDTMNLIKMIDKANHRMTTLQEELRLAERRYEAVIHSRAWLLTAPLRAVINRLRRPPR